MTTHDSPEPAGYDRAAVAGLSLEAISRTAKGFGGLGGATTARELAAGGASIFGGVFTFPLLTIRESAVAHNVAQLARFCTDQGVELAPHAKTTMAPQLFARQLDAGAWGLTVATVGQAQICREFGVRRLLVANEVVDPAGIRWLAGELDRDPGFDVSCYVDSVAGVRLLDAGLRSIGRSGPTAAPRRLSVLVELGFAGGRTGTRSVDDALLVARAAAATATLTVVGVAGYEGGLARERDDAGRAAVAAFCAQLLDVTGRLVAEGIIVGRPVVTAGGSAFPDLVAAGLTGDGSDGVTVVLRSGCYVTHDDGEYARVSPFTAADASPYALTAALELWAPVLSRPEPGLALLCAGRRDLGFDQGFAPPRGYRRTDGTLASAEGMRVTRLDDQHAYLEVPESSDLAVGDLVSLGISHPCTTLDRWSHVVQVDDRGVVTDVVLTYF